MKKIFLFALYLLFLTSVFAESRNALLIANGKYSNFGSLATPIKEARDLKKTLETLGFSVTVLENGNLEEMQDAIDDFGSVLQKQGGIGFFHYGGHAVQVNGTNYLIPVNADIPDEKKVRIRTLCVEEITTSMKAETNIIVLDACRNNPLPASNGRSATRGLVLTLEHPKNSIIIYSAQPNNIAQDGVFTPILTKCLLEKKELSAVLRDVRREVAAMTNGKQNPGSYDELTCEVYLAGFDTSANDTVVEKKVVETNQSIDYVTLGNEAFDKVNYKAAFSYYRKAGKITSALAQNNLGDMYRWGNGVNQNYKKAKEWYEKAASQGNSVAQYNLGEMYYFGYGGTPQNYTKAKDLWEKASAQGNQDAIQAIKEHF